MTSTTKKSRPAPSPAKTEPAAETLQAVTMPAAKLIDQIRQSVRDDLAEKVTRFIAEGYQEELQFLRSVLLEWEAQFHNMFRGPRSPLDRELPFFNAFQYALNSNTLVEVPDMDMVPLVERFIRDLDEYPEDSWKGKSRKIDEGIVEDRLRGEFNVFLRDAGKPSIDLMGDILARWNDLDRDPELIAALKDGRIVNQLAAAIEIELPAQVAAKTLRSLK